MGIRIFSSQYKKVVDFEALKKGKVGMYLCGPTVYDVPHLGHGRSATVFDMIRRYLVYSGYVVKYVSNYTDIDDKMIKRAEEKGVSVSALADEVIPHYKRQYKALNIMPPDVSPKATEHIDDMIMMIKELDKKGFAYVLDDGVYFDVAKYPYYGEISGQDLDSLQMGSRVEVKDAKRSPQDFVLWKFEKEGEPSWPSPWGAGRPGWHIECSAMSYCHLGSTFDIHAGGYDLLFPHHECEVAQSVSAFGEGAAPKYWLHNGFLNVDNEKMSKSLNNFKTLSDMLELYSGRVIRLMYLQTHYRNPLNFSEDLLQQAKSAIERIDNFVAKLRGVKGEGVMNGKLDDLLRNAEEKFRECMDNDFDSSGALGVVFELVKKVNVMISDNEMTAEDAGAVLDLLGNIDSVMGFIVSDVSEVSPEVLAMIEKREEARKNRDFSLADELREELRNHGVEVEDGPDGTIWRVNP
ncbi:cysteine--tRNA ligase [Candidatus Peregrinibacteria bacterium HGW-Peregrinibacteria-1]|jgi:cysteinyl-tRNA synthetase|nr:MAG: cysteine--tRNA ligase [Candidatus Peregrinibacteria bacterium HGW-Peregrinibacteria-1]